MALNDNNKQANHNNTTKNNSFKRLSKNKKNETDKKGKNEMIKIKDMIPGLLKGNIKNNISQTNVPNNDNNQNHIGAKLDEKEEIVTSNKEGTETKTGSVDKLHDNDNKNTSSKVSIATTRYSGVSRNSGSVVDLAVDIQQANAIQDDESHEITDKPFTSANADQYIKSAIPYLPLGVAVILLFVNVILPGFGTIISGFAVFCCGKPRVQTKDGHNAITCCVNFWVGVAQIFTVPFMLVGWFWSFVWGIYMVILAAEERNQRRSRKKKELQAKAVTAMDSQIRPWMLKT